MDRWYRKTDLRIPRIKTFSEKANMLLQIYRDKPVNW